jgi:hypothetical protein
MLQSLIGEKFADGVPGTALRLHDVQLAVVGDEIVQRFSYKCFRFQKG